MSASALILHFRAVDYDPRFNRKERIVVAGLPEERDEAIAEARDDGYDLFQQLPVQLLTGDWNDLPIGLTWEVR